MDETSVKNALKELRKVIGKRNFKQSIELVISFKDIDMKKTAKLEQYINLPSGKSKPSKICALVGNESEDSVGSADNVILSSDFNKYKEKSKIKKLARQYDYFIAQADMMPLIAQTFGRYFGPINKMPSPKAGCVVPARTNIAPIVSRLRNTVQIVANKTPFFMCGVGNESHKDEELIKNILSVLSAAENTLPNGRNNMGKIFIKSTMSKAVRI